MAGKVTDVFDKIYYDFMTTVTKKDYQIRILDQFKDCTVKLKDNPSEARSYVVEIKSKKRDNKRPEKAMDAINDMFSDTIRRVHSHCAKLSYVGGDYAGLKQALIKDIKGDFVARLMTDTDVRIISYSKNMERDLSCSGRFHL
ncbi:hypothetical protein EB796_006909 [Bugula neritina]|uniref:Uncharacterized protein n=1 Tax=Bugula neritina TaxID=10212 RepID=A0A7J7K816_BUGNE|nr:hypothetical protein EB796_006909 [Bugula neritina]